MPYFIGYKGKKLGAALSRTEAEEKLTALSRCFNQLEIIKEQKVSVSVPIQMQDEKSKDNVVPLSFIHPTYENTLYSERT
ncbi:MAG: hypothetical protein K0R67_3880 [Paenibacillus sp.]|jgi:hypothetical protein|nr:hypothetical protein [Paenibacillus sp.]